MHQTVAQKLAGVGRDEVGEPSTAGSVWSGGANWQGRLAHSISTTSWARSKPFSFRGGIGDDEHNPLFTVKRMGIIAVAAQTSRTRPILENHRDDGNGVEQDGGGGARLRSGTLHYPVAGFRRRQRATWADVDFQKGVLVVHNAKIRRARNYTKTREVPIIPDMRVLLERMRTQSTKPSDPICEVGYCEKSLTRACKIVGIPKLTHHEYPPSFCHAMHRSRR